MLCRLGRFKPSPLLARAPPLLHCTAARRGFRFQGPAHVEKVIENGYTEEQSPPLLDPNTSLHPNTSCFVWYYCLSFVGSIPCTMYVLRNIKTSLLGEQTEGDGVYICKLISPPVVQGRVGTSWHSCGSFPFRGPRENAGSGIRRLGGKVAGTRRCCPLRLWKLPSVSPFTPPPTHAWLFFVLVRKPKKPRWKGAMGRSTTSSRPSWRTSSIVAY